jgi:hypothetical protein
MKRISTVTIKRMTDADPDTSYLGRYSDRAELEYAIDRRHSLDCQSVEANHGDAVDKLERAIEYLGIERTVEGNKSDSTLWESLDDAIDTLTDAQSELQECDCSGGDAERGEFRYFNGCVENYKGESSADIRKYVRQDYERMERLQHGDWFFVGIRAEAEILIPSGDASIVQEITSGGLWGVESDSDKSYLAEIETEQLSELREQLRAVGFSTRAITTALKTLTHVNR